MKFKILYLAILGIIFSNNLYSQHSHGGQNNTGSSSHTEEVLPPNNGELIEVGKYKIELVTNLYSNQDQLLFYLYKGNFKLVPNTGITGTITIKTTVGEVVSVEEIIGKGEGLFVGQLKHKNSFKATISLLIKGKTITASFFNKGVNNGNDNSEKPVKQPKHNEHQH